MWGGGKEKPFISLYLFAISFFATFVNDRQATPAEELNLLVHVSTRKCSLCATVVVLPLPGPAFNTSLPDAFTYFLCSSDKIMVMTIYTLSGVSRRYLYTLEH